MFHLFKPFHSPLNIQIDIGFKDHAVIHTKMCWTKRTNNFEFVKFYTSGAERKTLEVCMVNDIELRNMVKKLTQKQ